MLTPKIKTLDSKLLVGMRVEMSLIENKTQQLWKTFMPQLDKVQNRISSDLISLQVYPRDYFKEFNPNTIYTKWAATEVSNYIDDDHNFESLELKGGLYAVFTYKGSSSEAFLFFQCVKGICDIEEQDGKVELFVFVCVSVRCPI